MQSRRSGPRFAAEDNVDQTFLVRRAAVLGAGTMGSRIAAHLANAGIPSLLLDMVPQGRRTAAQQTGSGGPGRAGQGQAGRVL